jgi:ATP synthase protein I
MPDADALYQDEGPDTDFKPLTASQASQWRARNPVQSMWVLVWMQVVVGAVCAVLAGLYGGGVLAKSAGYGAMAVILPAAMFVRGVKDGSQAGSGLAWMRFCVWELAKVGLTVAMLVAAPRLIVDLNWLALLLGMVVTQKVYWVALWLRPRVPVGAVKI